MCTRQQYVDIVDYVRSFGKPNVYAAKVPIPSKFNFPLMYSLAESVSDREVIQFLMYGWPLNHDGRPVAQTLSNHATARNHPRSVEEYIKKEWELGCLLGPFLTPPWSHQVAISPMSTRVKKNSSKLRIIMDLSWPLDGTDVNSGISKERYLNQHINIMYPTVDKLCIRASQLKYNCLGYKRDLDRAFKQLFVDFSDWPLQGIYWNQMVFFD